MDYIGELTMRVYSQFQWPPAAADNPGYILTDRQSKIIRKYADEVNLNRMDTRSALERAIGDICGRNYFPNKDQRNTPR